MNVAKIVMFIFALAAILSMVAIGYSIAVGSIWGSVLAIIALIAVFGLGFTMKSKFRNQGLL